MVKNYRNGDRVRCIDPGGHSYLTLNKIYICKITGNTIGILNDDRGNCTMGLFGRRFKKATPELSKKIKIL